MATYTVSTSAELEARLKKASGGDIFELDAGNYGDLALRKLDFDSEVIVRSADPDDPAVFNKINIISSSHLTFDSVFIDFTPTKGTVEWSTGFRAVQGVSHITLRNSRIEGGDSIAGTSPNADAGDQGKKGILGEPIGRAVTISGTNIVIENNDISHFKNGIVMGGDGNSILGNNIYDLRTSPLRGNGNDLTIDGNYFHDSSPWKIGGQGDHGDYIHLWTGSKGKPMSNITITNNVLSDEKGGSLLGIYLDDDNNGVGYKNVHVDNNVIYSSTGQAVRFENVSGATISQNTFLNKDGAEKKSSLLVIEDGTKNVHVENNIFSTFLSEGAQKALAKKGFTFENNLDVSYGDLNADNHIERIFSDSRIEGSGLWAKTVISGSVADGLGSTLMHVDPAPAQLTPVFEVETAPGSGKELVLRADGTRGPDGPVTGSGAQFIWDFADGSTGSGQVVRHVYAGAGLYDATLTVIMPDGTTAKAVSEIGVVGADVLSYNPGTGMFQAEGYGTTTPVEDSNAAAIVSGVGLGVNLGGSGQQVGIDRDHLDRLFGATSFDMSMTLRADKLGSTGEVARVHGNLTLSVVAQGEIKLELSTDTQNVVLSTTGVTVNDGADHDIRIGFDNGTNSLIIYVDGQIAGATGIEGDMRSDYPRALVFGNPWGSKNFDGTLTAFDLEVGNRVFPDYAGDLLPPSGDVTPDPETPQPETPDVETPDPETPDPETPQTETPDPETPDVDAGTDDPGAPDTPPGTPPDTAPDTPDPESGGRQEEGNAETDDSAGQDQPETPIDYEPVQPGEPLYKADFAQAETPGNGIRLLGDSHVLQDSDGTLKVMLDGDGDFVTLGRVEELENSQQLNIALDFQRSEVGGGNERMVWNHAKFGISVKDDALIIYVANNDQPLYRGFEIGNAGVGDTEEHSLNVAIDAEADRLQVVLDGEVVLDEQDTDLDFVGAGGREAGWSIGTAWNRFYEGSVSEFELDDQAIFVDDATVLV